MFRSMTRLASLPNAAKMIRSLPSQACQGPNKTEFFSRSYNFATAASHHQRFAQHSPTPARFFSSSSSTTSSFSTTSNRFTSPPSTASSLLSKTIPPKTTPNMQFGQTIRAFHKGASRTGADKHGFEYSRRGFFWAARHRAHHEHAREFWSRYGRHHRLHYLRHDHPRSFVRRMMFISTLFVAVPAVFVFDCPYSTLIFVPLAVGGGLLLTRGLLFYVLPLAIVGGATAFWFFATPVARPLKDLHRVLKQNEKGEYASALNNLGPDWSIQPAKEGEWFHWEFPQPANGKKGNNTGSTLDKVNIRVALFDTKDQSERKQRTLTFLDRINKFDDSERHIKKWSSRNAPCPIENVMVRRDGNHVVITMEDDGEKIMEQSWAQMYLTLGRMVDRAATELEARHPGKKLGEQVVLVYKNKDDSCSNRWSPYGNVAIRIPFNRTWIHDMADE
ncbi:hypothetical protein BGZ94_003695 [Podila epigama]|nr:hypothetical protein BGZ94_003695 [Podila epigama]